MNSAAWMQNPNIRLALYVAASALPVLIANLSTGEVNWLTACVVLANMLTTAKAFMSDPGQLPSAAVAKMTAKVNEVADHVSDKADEVADEIISRKKE